MRLDALVTDFEKVTLEDDFDYRRANNPLEFFHQPRFATHSRLNRRV